MSLQYTNFKTKSYLTKLIVYIHKIKGQTKTSSFKIKINDLLIRKAYYTVNSFSNDQSI